MTIGKYIAGLIWQY